MTALIITSNRAWSRNHCRRFFRLFRTFSVVSFARTPSMESCILCSPALLSVSISSGRKRNPFEIMLVR